MTHWDNPPAIRPQGDPLPVQIYDGLTRVRRVVRSPGDGQGPVRIYVCGITPYDSSHLGHAFTAVQFDVLRRTLVDCGHEVEMCHNITDVDDPLFAKAESLGVDWRVLASEQVDKYRSSMAALNVIAPEHYVPVSDVIGEILSDAAAIRDRGHAYRVEGTTYFRYTDPGRPRLAEELTEAQLIDVARNNGGDPDRAGKRHPLDPPLWVPSAPGEPRWTGPLGEGRPGWHLECVTIARRSLGALPIDIQGGGADLVFPHHEMSRLESIALCDVPMARSYMHTAMLRMDGAKMSKSLGNLIIASDLVAEGWEPVVIRLALAGYHYREPLDWGPTHLATARTRIERWRRAASRPAGPDFAQARRKSRALLADDLNLPACLSVLDAWCADPVRDSESGPSEFSAWVANTLGIVI